MTPKRTHKNIWSRTQQQQQQQRTLQLSDLFDYVVLLFVQQNKMELEFPMSPVEVSDPLEDRPCVRTPRQTVDLVLHQDSYHYHHLFSHTHTHTTHEGREGITM